MEHVAQLTARNLHPHLVLYGPPGSGKTTLSRQWATRFAHRYDIDAAFDNGLELFREWIDQITKYKQQGSVCIIENADLLSHACQQALRRILETQSDRVRFVFCVLGDDPGACLLPAILSRCVCLGLQEPVAAAAPPPTVQWAPILALPATPTHPAMAV
jgi:replication-associated recombination protein RarA